MTTRYQVFKINEDGTQSAESPKYRNELVAQRGRDSAERVAKLEHRQKRAKGFIGYLPKFVVREVQGE